MTINFSEHLKTFVAPKKEEENKATRLVADTVHVLSVTFATLMDVRSSLTQFTTFLTIGVFRPFDNDVG